MSTNLRNHLQAILDEHGSLTPVLVKEVARNPEHPLNPHVFDCPPEEASERYYTARAAQLLRVTYRPIPGKPIDLRAFQCVRGEESPTSEYVPTEQVLADDFQRQLLFRSLKRDWQIFKRRYDHMDEFWKFIQGEFGEAS